MRAITTAVAMNWAPGDVVEVTNVLWRVSKVLGARGAILDPVPSAHVKGTGGVIADVVAGILYVAASNMLDVHERTPFKLPSGHEFHTCLCRWCYAACQLMGEYETQ